MSNELYLSQPDEDTKSWIKKYATPFHFEVLEDGHIQLSESKYVTETNVFFLYSFDNKTWQDWNSVNGTDVTSGQKLYLKAKTENSKLGAIRILYSFSATNKVNVAGNIMSLLYNDFASKTTINSSCAFAMIFFNLTTLIDASNLILPATTLSENCYRLMFYNCSSLIAAPELPATKLAAGCYYLMFNGCTSITELHYPKSIENNSIFKSINGSPWFGATNATIYYDL